MNLTTRGRVVAAGTGAGFLWAAMFGIQAMNAVVVPAVIALAVGYVTVSTTVEPRIQREAPEPGFPDQERQITMNVDVGRSTTVFVVDQLPQAIEPVGDAGEFARAGTVTYTVRPTQRGLHELGPVRVDIRGPFGLFAKSIDVDARISLMTYPRVEELGGLETDPAVLPRGAPQRERYEFDNLREYHRGDAVRDIHWPSSAKRPGEDLVVKQFISDRDAGDISIAGSADPDRVNDMATAAASLAIALLERGIDVGMTLPDATVDVGSGGTHWMELLAALARTEGGRLPQNVIDASSIGIRAHAGDANVQIRIGGTWHRYEELKHGAETTHTPEQIPHVVAADGGGDR